MKRQLRIGFCLIGCALMAPTGSAFAQQLNAQPATTATAPAARPALKFGADYQLAAWLAADAHVELSTAQLAEQKSATDEVRELARAEATRQAQIINALRPLLGDEALQPPLPPAEAAKAKAAEVATAPVAQTATPPAGAAQPTPPVVSTAAGPAFTLVSLKRSLADRAGTTLLGDLNKASGEAFDRRYRDHLAVAQLRQADTLQTFREHASPTLQAVIDSLLPR
jgi:predicted outer membrane protein